ncbi:p450 domain-containing protein [Cephalotus follicularis]|uniref:p450 domain-containing protein n=1 Tax=Cephalotus follicularis TaxID=3775 RepID=A0A1Q3BU65_CEPFO|nr:p450 domain-containing protein [Cephalotus follicularis]
MEAEPYLIMKIVVSVVLGGLVGLIFHLYNVLWLRQERSRSKLQKQGITGPPPSFLLGNIPEMTRIKLQVAPRDEQNVGFIAHEWFSTVFPHIIKWQNEYGPVFVYSTGNIQQVCVTDVHMAKEISQCTSLSLGKPSYLSKDRGPLLGQGIISSNGPIWSYQRKIIAPEFYLDKVKMMINLMVDSTTTMLKSWESRIEIKGGIADIKVDEDLRSLSADVISRACFGSNYSKGEQIFARLRLLQKTMSMSSIGIPGMRYFPSKNNRDIWKLDKEIHSLILTVVKQRMKSPSEKNLLQTILEAAGDYDAFPPNVSRDKFIVDNCKNIYFAGHETSAITASWSLMLLAAHPDWQDRVRAEVLEICKGNNPDADMLRRMKTLTMVIQETLRLYPPAVFVVREALQDLEFNDIVYPRGMGIQIPIPIIQQHPDLWGPDAHQFNPERFARGILGASKISQAYMPFGVGARTCAGQNFAMTELKVILCLTLSKFCFSLSPSYCHLPTFKLVVEPGHGVCLCMKKV